MAERKESRYKSPIAEAITKQERTRSDEELPSIWDKEYQDRITRLKRQNILKERAKVKKRDAVKSAVQNALERRTSPSQPIPPTNGTRPLSQRELGFRVHNYSFRTKRRERGIHAKIKTPRNVPVRKEGITWTTLVPEQKDK